MNKLERRQLGIKRARRILKIWRARLTHGFDDPYYKDGGMCERHLFQKKVPCSCVMCGNPRRHLGEVTVQEKKSDISLLELP